MDQEQEIFFTQDTESKDSKQNFVSDSTSITFVDGLKGRLLYRGINIAELAAHASFEETAWLLISGTLPSQSKLEGFQWGLRTMSHSHEKVLRIIEEFPQQSHPLFVLQTSLAALSCLDRSEEYLEEENHVEKVTRIIAQTPVILSAAYRHYLGLPMLEARSDLNFVENFIYMLFGKILTKKQTRFLEVAMILQMDHGLTPESCTARLVTSALSHFYAAASAAVGACGRTMHLGMNELVLEMLKNARESGNIEQFVKNILISGKKILGMGHDVYKTVDPRALIFKDLLSQLTSQDEKESDFILLSQIEEESRKYFQERKTPVHANIDFWSGSVYKKLGIHPILYSAIFAAARMVGWCAHILETKRNSKIYAMRSGYFGQFDIPYTLLKER
jgi:citrate synthase